jgi:hypothetical protein
MPVFSCSDITELLHAHRDVLRHLKQVDVQLEFPGT